SHAPDTTAFDAFVKQWFYEVVVPQYQIVDPVATKIGDAWEVKATVKNTGTGVMPVEFAAVRGERFSRGSSQKEPWKDARTWVVLAAGDHRPIVIRCPFEPQRLVVDPDVKVLMLERQKADVKLKSAAPGTERLANAQR